jgi:hypothetical protein
VSRSPVFEQIRSTDQKGWTPIQIVSLPAVSTVQTFDKND